MLRTATGHLRVPEPAPPSSSLPPPQLLSPAQLRGPGAAFTPGKSPVPSARPGPSAQTAGAAGVSPLQGTPLTRVAPAATAGHAGTAPAAAGGAPPGGGALAERVTLAELIRRTTAAQREAKRTATKQKRATARQMQEAVAGPDNGGYAGPWQDDDVEVGLGGPRHRGDGAATLSLPPGPQTVPLDADGNDLVVAHPGTVALVPPHQAHLPPLPMAPQVQVVNGRIVVNEHSLTVVQPSQGDGGGQAGAMVRSGQPPVLNSNSYANRQRVEKWGVQDTALFYRALSQFGTDFSLIERLFPGRTRHQIKNKFSSEERLAPHKVDAALRDRTGGGGTGAGGTSSVQAYKDMIESLKRSQAEEQARHERLQQAAIAAAAKQAADAAAAEAASRAERERLVAAADERRQEADQARAASAAAAAAAAAAAPPPVARPQPPKEAQQADVPAAVAAVPKAAKPAKARKQRVNLLAEPSPMAPPPGGTGAGGGAPKPKAVAVPPPAAAGRGRGVMNGDASVAAGEAAVRRALAGLGK